MRKLKNVLYVTTLGSHLSVKNKSICVTNEEISRTVPVHNIETVICFGNMTVTTQFMNFCAENDVKIVFLSEYGRYFGSFYGAQKGNVFLRLEQYKRFTDNSISVNCAREIVGAKIKNSIRVLRKSAPDSEKVKAVSVEMEEMLKELPGVTSTESLLGYEGISAEKYFSVFDEMILTDDKDMKFVRRSRRPPENNVNALLSYVYTLLQSEVASAVESCGLDPQVGVLHALNYAKLSLVYDMMEEYRAALCDRFVLSLINMNQIRSEDFEKKDGMILLTRKGRNTVISEWQKRKQDEIFIKKYDTSVPIGLIPFLQAQLMSEYLRDEAEKYTAFVWR